MEKIVNIMNIKLSLDRITLEGELENIINGNLSLGLKSDNIDRVLGELALNEIKFNKWVLLTKNAEDPLNNVNINK